MPFFRRYRELHDDPEFPFRVGHLLGSVDMAGHFLSNSGDADKERIGAVLKAQTGWFWEHRVPTAQGPASGPLGPSASGDGWMAPSPSEDVTAIRKPDKG